MLQGANETEEAGTAGFDGGGATAFSHDEGTKGPKAEHLSDFKAEVHCAPAQLSGRLPHVYPIVLLSGF